MLLKSWGPEHQWGGPCSLHLGTQMSPGFSSLWVMWEVGMPHLCGLCSPLHNGRSFRWEPSVILGSHMRVHCAHWIQSPRMLLLQLPCGSHPTSWGPLASLLTLLPEPLVLCLSALLNPNHTEFHDQWGEDVLPTWGLLCCLGLLSGALCLKSLLLLTKLTAPGTYPWAGKKTADLFWCSQQIKNDLNILNNLKKNQKKDNILWCENYMKFTFQCP